MFKLANNESFTYPVTVEVNSNGGAIRKDKFTATFKRLGTSEVTTWVDRLVEAGRQGLDSLFQTQRELAQEVVINWQDVVGDDGAPVTFSPERLAEALEIHPVPSSIANAWMEAVSGGAKTKNLR
ncbi:MAG: hypothetical protein RL018_1711 [Pseudomonadota bacterium]|jgi:hypothetical protein